MSRSSSETSTPVTPAVAERRERQLAAMQHYQAMWDLIPLPIQMLSTLAAAKALGLPEPLMSVVLAIFN